MSKPRRTPRPALEPRYTLAQAMQLLGCGPTRLHELLKLGREYGARLHPSKGGLWPTYKLSHKCRLVPASAIERHTRHMARVHGEGRMVESVV
jgi:hypothetical protein